MDNQVSGGKAFVARFSRLGLINSFALGKIPYVPRAKPREQCEWKTFLASPKTLQGIEFHGKRNFFYGGNIDIFT